MILDAKTITILMGCQKHELVLCRGQSFNEITYAK